MESSTVNLDIEPEEKYFGEYNIKSRPKRDGHTLRFRWTGNGDMVTEIQRKNLKEERYDPYFDAGDHANKMKHIPITSIDEYFDVGFWAKQSRYCSYSEGKRTLNSLDKWEDVENALETNSVRITKEYNRYYGRCTIHYDLPITGHVLCENDQSFGRHHGRSNSSRFNPAWLKWNGKYYDPKYLYEYIPSDSSIPADSRYQDHSGSLRVVCPLIRNRKFDPSTATGYIKDYNLTRIAATSYSSKNHITHYRGNIFSLSKNKSPNTVTKGNVPFIEVDLGDVFDVKAIGTLGGYPTNINLFPHTSSDFYFQQKRQEDEEERALGHTRSLKKIRRISHRGRRRYVYTVRDTSDIAWVTSYSIQYRDMTSGKWYDYNNSNVNPFEGNHDVATEKLNRVSLVTRYIRLKPLESHKKPNVRVMVYGDPVTGKASASEAITAGMDKSVDRSNKRLNRKKYLKCVKPAVSDDEDAFWAPCDNDSDACINETKPATAHSLANKNNNAKDIENTIRYSLEPKAAKYMLDGYGGHYDCYGQVSKHLSKRSLLHDIEEDADIFWKEMEEPCS